MTFDETLYGRGSDDGDDFGDNESFDDVIDDEEERRAGGRRGRTGRTGRRLR